MRLNLTKNASMKLRPFIFWPHLIAGVTVGLVILLMCVTGVLLAYERQLNAWADSRFESSPPAAGAAPLRIDALLTRFRDANPDVSPSTISVRADRLSVVVVAAGPRTFYVDRYSGAVVGEASPGGIRAFLSVVREWHRWFAVGTDARPIARAVTGWSNVIFLFIISSGIYLWFPRKWTWPQVRNVVLLNPRARGKARDFNWHNAIGSWCAVPLFVVVLCATPISFGWANALVYRAVGDAPPQTGGERERGGRPDSRRSSIHVPSNVDVLWTSAQARVPDWRLISMRLPASSSAPVVFTIDRGNGGQPHLRSTLTLDSQSGRETRYEAFSDLTLGRRIRNTMRFAHTGEVLGIPGQTVAGIVSAGGAVLVWTGLSLAWRRWSSWRSRASRGSELARAESAA